MSDTVTMALQPLATTGGTLLTVWQPVSFDVSRTELRLMAHDCATGSLAPTQWLAVTNGNLLLNLPSGEID